ncbi:MAG: hypothetical protein ABIH78_03465 [Candidatus Peregrinibacteria bacterium]
MSILIGLIVALLIGGGVYYALMFSQKDEQTDSGNPQSVNENESQPDIQAPPFDEIDTQSESYEAI